jgi:hypothetical protein
MSFQIDKYEEFLNCWEDIPIYETKQDPLDLDSLYRPRYTFICSNDPTETNCGSTAPTRGKDTATTQKDMSAFGQYQGDEESFRLILNANPPIDIPYDIRSSLPIVYASTGPDLHPQLNTVLSIENQNIPDSQKLLLDWHNRFAHLNFARVRQFLRQIPFIANKFGDATKCDPPM